MTEPTEPSAPRTFHGRCHCGDVRFEVDLDLGRGLYRCNCTLCRRRGAVTAMASPGDLRLERDGSTAYPEGATNAFFFCARCGIHTHAVGHVEELGGDFVVVNVNCLEDLDREGLAYAILDGRDETWEARSMQPLTG